MNSNSNLNSVRDSNSRTLDVKALLLDRIDPVNSSDKNYNSTVVTTLHFSTQNPFIVIKTTLHLNSCWRLRLSSLRSNHRRRLNRHQVRFRPMRKRPLRTYKWTPVESRRNIRVSAQFQAFGFECAVFTFMLFNVLFTVADTSGYCCPITDWHSVYIPFPFNEILQPKWFTQHIHANVCCRIHHPKNNGPAFASSNNNNINRDSAQKLKVFFFFVFCIRCYVHD